jgi:septum formation protein
VAPYRILILASQSPRRSDLLKAAGIPFEVKITRVREKTDRCLPHATPRKLVLHNAELKTKAVSQKFPTRWVLGADTLVVIGSKILGKPGTMNEAEQMIQSLSGRTHRVITGVCLHGPKRARRSFSVTTQVTFKRMTLVQIRRYLKKIHPLDKAGAYAAQEHRNLIIRKIEGSFTNVVGLPMERVKKELKRIAAIS